MWASSTWACRLKISTARNFGQIFGFWSSSLATLHLLPPIWPIIKAGLHYVSWCVQIVALPCLMLALLFRLIPAYRSSYSPRTYMQYCACWLNYYYSFVGSRMSYISWLSLPSVLPASLLRTWTWLPLSPSPMQRNPSAKLIKCPWKWSDTNMGLPGCPSLRC